MSRKSRFSIFSCYLHRYFFFFLVKQACLRYLHFLNHIRHNHKDNKKKTKQNKTKQKQKNKGGGEGRGGRGDPLHMNFKWRNLTSWRNLRFKNICYFPHLLSFFFSSTNRCRDSLHLGLTNKWKGQAPCKNSKSHWTTHPPSPPV